VHFVFPDFFFFTFSRNYSPLPLSLVQTPLLTPGFSRWFAGMVGSIPVFFALPSLAFCLFFSLSSSLTEWVIDGRYTSESRPPPYPFQRTFLGTDAPRLLPPPPPPPPPPPTPPNIVSPPHPPPLDLLDTTPFFHITPAAAYSLNILSARPREDALSALPPPAVVIESFSFRTSGLVPLLAFVLPVPRVSSRSTSRCLRDHLLPGGDHFSSLPWSDVLTFNVPELKKCEFFV